MTGPTSLYVRGEILPTPWQSFRREKGMGERIGMALVGGFLGFLLCGGDGASLSAHLGIAWVFFFALPVILPLITRRSAETIIAHIRRSGAKGSIPPTWKIFPCGDCRVSLSV